MAFSFLSGDRAEASGLSRPRERRSESSGATECRLALAIASAAFDVAPEDVGAPARRDAGAAYARHVAIYLAHIVFQLPMRVVADGFGRDRTSVRHAVRRIEDRRDDAAFDRRMERLEHVASFCRSAGTDAREGAVR